MDHGGEEAEDALTEAYRHEDAMADAASQTVGTAWLFAIVPAGLVMLLLSALLGDWLWRLLPVFAIGAMIAPLLARLVVRWRSDLPIDLPGHGRITGVRKKRRVLAAAGLLFAVLAWDQLVGPALTAWLRETLLAWRI